MCSNDKVSGAQFLDQVWISLDSEFRPFPLKETAPIACDQTKNLSIPLTPLYTNVRSIIRSFPQASINVGFDIDDTVLDSNLTFDKAAQKFPRSSEDFWAFVNKSDGEYSTVKHTARLLVQEHQKRGDKIYFITARRHTEDETLSQLLSESLNIEREEVNLFFTNGSDKSKWLSQYNTVVYYGDSDSDIVSTMEIGARPVRVLRLNRGDDRPESSYRPGYYGETVIINSDL